MPDRRLHGLLHEHPPRDGGRPPVPARQSAAAQLQVGAHRLPRPRVVGGRQRPVDSPSGRPVQGARRRRSRRRSDASASTTNWSSASSSRGPMRRASRCRSPMPRRISSASRSSTTGRRATSRRGNTSRSDRSCRRISRRPCRRGSSRWRRSRRFARRSRGPRAILRRCPTSIRRTTARRGAVDIALEVVAVDARHAHRRPAAAAAHAVELPRQLLDDGAAGRASHRQRLQPRAGRPHGLRHAVRTGARAGRLAARACRAAARRRSSSPTARGAAFSRTATR